jgi:hypothetical protein
MDIAAALGEPPERLLKINAFFQACDPARITPPPAGSRAHAEVRQLRRSRRCSGFLRSTLNDQPHHD